MMQLIVETHRAAFMARRVPLRVMQKILLRASFSSSSSSFMKWEGGVSMVQGASRGIGLEFVIFSSLLFPFWFHFHFYIPSIFLITYNSWTAFKLGIVLVISHKNFQTGFAFCVQICRFGLSLDGPLYWIWRCKFIILYFCYFFF